MLEVPGLSATTKLLLAVALQFWTAPVASHMIGRAAHAAKIRPDEPWVIDELADVEAAAEATADDA
jgi:multisubunit Na+/H+ antiporter MnhG subunit